MWVKFTLWILVIILMIYDHSIMYLKGFCSGEFLFSIVIFGSCWFKLSNKSCLDHLLTFFMHESNNVCLSVWNQHDSSIPFQNTTATMSLLSKNIQMNSDAARLKSHLSSCITVQSSSRSIIFYVKEATGTQAGYGSHFILHDTSFKYKVASHQRLNPLCLWFPFWGRID